MEEIMNKSYENESNKFYKGHVVVIPYPSQGHINPLLQFAKRLASKGVKATIATTRYTVASINAPGVAVAPISDGFDAAGFAEAESVDAFLRSFRSNGSATLSRLVRGFAATDTPVSCIVYDAFLGWALDVARRHGVAGAAFFTNSAAVSVVFCRLHHGLLALPLEDDDMPLSSVPGVPPLHFRDLPSFLMLPESYPAYLAMKLSQFSNLKSADFVFANTFEALEGEVAEGASKHWPAKLIGPMVPSAYLDGRIEGDKGYGASLWKPLSEECLRWLETKPPRSVVYVSFGSMVSLTEKQMGELAWGLKASGSHFLWVVKEHERDKLPDGFAEMAKGKGKGLIVAWCNQLEVLANKAIGCFVTHCGWNSTLEGLSLGVPMVAIPQWADQLTDAKFIADVWEVGVRPKEDEKGVVTREDLVASLKEVMEGKRSQKIKRNASFWREKAKEAVGEGGSSDKCIDEFVWFLRSFGKKRGESKVFMNGNGVR